MSGWLLQALLVTVQSLSTLFPIVYFRSDMTHARTNRSALADGFQSELKRKLEASIF
jgi:hypothetical protein